MVEIRKHKGQCATSYPKLQEQAVHQLYLLFGESKDAVLLCDLEVNQILLALRKAWRAHSLSEYTYKKASICR